MNEKTLTEAEIMKALECCTKGFCGNCDRIHNGKSALNCMTELNRYAFDLITDKNDTLEMYRRNISLLDEQILAKDKKIEELQHEKNELQHEIVSCKAEAIKEFAERVKKEIACFVPNVDDVREVIDNTAKEMGVEL